MEQLHAFVTVMLQLFLFLFIIGAAMPVLWVLVVMLDVMLECIFPSPDKEAIDRYRRQYGESYKTKEPFVPLLPKPVTPKKRTAVPLDEEPVENNNG